MSVVAVSFLCVGETAVVWPLRYLWMEGQNMSQLEILGNDGKPVLYASLQDGNLSLEFEYYGNATGEADLEVIYTIKPDAVAVIKSKFGCAPDMETMAALASISTRGFGEELRDAIRDGEIASERFSWMSFDD